jgi:methionyl-tRNA formyltransferase
VNDRSTPSLRIVFFGTPDFAEAGLRAVHESDHQVAGVVTAPDKPAGRGQRVSESAVKRAAVELGLPLAQPEKLKSADFLAQLDQWQADVYCVVAFRMLPEVVWNRPRLGTINVHGSLLPNFRGAAPIQHAVASGASRTGVTSFFITREIDNGALLLQRACVIHPDDTAGVIYGRLMEEGAGLLVDTLNTLAEGYIQGIPQDRLIAGNEKEAPKLFRQDGRVDWRRPAEQVRDFIRGMTPFPGAWSTLNGATFKVHEVEVPSSYPDLPKLEPGQCHTAGGPWWVGTGSHPILLRTAQLAGKPSMAAEDILRGYRYPVEDLGTSGH